MNLHRLYSPNLYNSLEGKLGRNKFYYIFICWLKKKNDLFNLPALSV